MLSTLNDILVLFSSVSAISFSLVVNPFPQISNFDKVFLLFQCLYVFHSLHTVGVSILVCLLQFFRDKVCVFLLTILIFYFHRFVRTSFDVLEFWRFSVFKTTAFTEGSKVSSSGQTTRVILLSCRLGKNQLFRQVKSAKNNRVAAPNSSLRHCLNHSPSSYRIFSEEY